MTLVVSEAMLSRAHVAQHANGTPSPISQVQARPGRQHPRNGVSSWCRGVTAREVVDGCHGDWDAPNRRPGVRSGDARTQTVRKLLHPSISALLSLARESWITFPGHFETSVAPRLANRKQN
jgi:hypothetical protein